MKAEKVSQKEAVCVNYRNLRVRFYYNQFVKRLRGNSGVVKISEGKGKYICKTKCLRLDINLNLKMHNTT